MNFDFTDDQREIQRTARELLTARSGVRARARGGGVRRARLRRRPVGGAGRPRLGRDRDPGGVRRPGARAAGAGDRRRAARLGGRRRRASSPTRSPRSSCSAPAASASASCCCRSSRSGARRRPSGVARDGVAELVPDGDSARWIILIEGERAAVHDARAGGVEIEPRETIDPTRRYARVQVHADRCRRRRGCSTARSRAGLDRAEVVLAAELTGVAQRALELTVAYVKERETVRDADRRLPGGLAPRRAAAAGDRGRALGGLVRRLGGRRRAGGARPRRRRWRRRPPPTPAATSPPPRSSCTAGSASPGRPTSTGSTSAPSSTPPCSAARRPHRRRIARLARTAPPRAPSLSADDEVAAGLGHA